MMTMQRKAGFTLIELMITIAIVGILAAIAIPAYQDYTRRARFSEIVLATAPYKQAVAECIQDTGTATGCNEGTNSIPAALGAEGLIASLGVTNGVILVTPTASNGITALDTYQLDPSVTAGNRVSWTVSGGALAAGYVKQ